MRLERYWPNDDLRKTKFYHFGFPWATAIHVAAEHTDSMSFFIPDALTIEEASLAFWAGEYQPENSVSVDGYGLYDNLAPDDIAFRYLSLNTGRHEVQVSGNVMLAITVRE